MKSIGIENEKLNALYMAKPIKLRPSKILVILNPRCRDFIIKMSKIFLGFILLFSFQIAASHYVLELTDQNFQEALDTYPSIMIDFYASWCGHCQHFKPIYEKTSVLMHNEGMETVLARIDAYTYSAIKRKWRIGGYPTILYYQHGQMIEKYPGLRKVDDIVAYLDEQEKNLAN